MLERPERLSSQAFRFLSVRLALLEAETPADAGLRRACRRCCELSSGGSAPRMGIGTPRVKC